MMIKQFFNLWLLIILSSTYLLSCSEEQEPKPAEVEITSSPVTTAFVDSIYEYEISATGGDSIKFFIETAPENMVLNSLTGKLTWIPQETDDFNNKVIIEATNNHESVKHEFRIRVAGLNVEGFKTSTLENEGFNQNRIENIIKNVRNDDKSKIHSVLILKNDKLVLEEYFDGLTNSWPSNIRDEVTFNRSIPHMQASTTKSLISIFVGLAVDQGLIQSINDTVFKYFPEYPQIDNQSADKKGITIRHLLTMTSGLDYGSPDWLSFVNNISVTGDWVKSTLDCPVIDPPGTVWNYFSGGPHVLGALVANAAGMPLDDFAAQYLFEPLGIVDVEWAYSTLGRAFGGGSHKMRPIDMVKIGSLFANNGNWNGEQIISEEWVQESTAEYYTPSDGYGYLWWRPKHINHNEVFLAAGGGGQEIFIFPTLNMVVVFTAGYYENSEGYEFALSFINNNLLSF